MELEAVLLELARSLSGLADQRRTQWRDAAGQGFEARFLRPLSEVVEEFHRSAEDFAAAANAAFVELDR